MERLIILSALLVGPIYLVMLAAIYFARRLFPDMQILFELTEPMLILAAATLAFAVAGMLVQGI